MSLQEQRAAIEGYAARNSLTISRWFEERETAAKRGRPIFNRMIALLREGKAVGVIMHKIDRSARNLRDWSDLGEVIDSGIDVHFANEALDLNSRGGRLSADIQAVVAADYIRNLRDETIKGMRGRYKQGLFPLPAPIGYADQGSGQPKTIDPTQGPLVRQMFELYASGRYGHSQLADVMFELGLRTKRGQRVEKSTFAWMLANPFYYGLIRLKATGELFEGRHEPLISYTLFRAARAVCDQRLSKRVVKHDFSYRRSVRCAICGYNLTGEISKGIVYYRCHTKRCPPNAIRDDILTDALVQSLSLLEVGQVERPFLANIIQCIEADSKLQRNEIIQSLQATLGNVEERLSRLADAYLDGVLDANVLRDKQKTLLQERKDIEGKLNLVRQRQDLLVEKLKEFLDFAASLRTVFSQAAPIVRQDMLRRVAVRVTVDKRQANVILNKPFRLFAQRPRVQSTTGHGVRHQEGSTLNSDVGAESTVAVDSSEPDPACASTDEECGCPPQSGVQTRMEKLFLEIGKSLLEVPSDGDSSPK